MLSTSNISIQFGAKPLFENVTVKFADGNHYGLIGAIEFAPQEGKPGARGFEVFLKCFEQGLLVRVTGDIIALSPPLVIEKQHMDRLFTTLAAVIRKL